MAKYKLIPDDRGGYEIHKSVATGHGEHTYKFVSYADTEEKAREGVDNLERPVIEIGEDDE